MSDDTRSCTIPTTHGFTLDGVLHPAAEPIGLAVVTHPHPQMGGDMHNPVTVGLASALAGAGITALRFDFRGTGRSGGTHDEGDGERDDVTAAIDAVIAETGGPAGLAVVGAGYSFGADVLLACDDARLAAVVAVAPPLRVLGADVLAAPRGRGPTLLLSPAHDQFCPPQRARETSQAWPDTAVEAIEGADHLLTGAVRRAGERGAAFLAAACVDR